MNVSKRNNDIKKNCEVYPLRKFYFNSLSPAEGPPVQQMTDHIFDHIKNDESILPAQQVLDYLINIIKKNYN